MEKIREKEELKERYLKVRSFTEKLCEPLKPEDFVVQPVTDVSPPKWHLAHTTWFFETFILKEFHNKYKLFNTSYNYLFNSYYESIGDRLLRSHRGNLTRPVFEEILEYRAYVDYHVGNLLDNPCTDEKLCYLIELGLQHEQQHQELIITDIKFIFGHNPVFPIYISDGRTPPRPKRSAEPRFLDIPAGVYEIGFQGNGFSYDNEAPRHKAYVNSFRIMNRLVTNEEFLEFINDGGYKDFRHWHLEGWELIKCKNWESPMYWMKKNNNWCEYTLQGLKPLVPDAPVTHISFYEAAAYASWKGKRLPTEAEWEAAADFLQQPVSGNFIESGVFHPMAKIGDTMQMFGDCWEWTYSAYHPYPGYKRQPGALGEYNGKFMINQIVLRGGSCATPASHIRKSYRNFFHPDKRWQFSGIRLAENY
jgi:ergothioneine biosynthesis protein EgtB